MDHDPQILVIDDELIIRKGCQRILTSEGYEVLCVEDGTKGLEVIQDKIIDLVLLDLQMPGMDGIEVLTRIKRLKPRLTVIIITGYATVDKAIAAMQQGAFDFLAKPFLPDQLRRIVQKALASKGTQSAVLPDTRKEEPTLSMQDAIASASLRCAEVGLLTTDLQGVVTSVNPHLQKLLRKMDTNLVGLSLQEVLTDNSLLNAWMKVVTEGVLATLEILLPGTTECFLKIHCSPLIMRDCAGISGAVLAIGDITIGKKTDELKSEFVGLVAHELRAPLSTIQQLVYFLRDGEAGAISDVQHDLLTRVQLRLGELLDLVKNLLNIAKMESGTLVFRMEQIHLSPLLEGCIDSFRVAAEARRITLKFTSSETLPQIMADRNNLRIALSNLIGNAVKYNKEGGRVVVDLRHREDKLAVTIKDAGVGIPQEDLPRIFDKFYRVKDEHTRWITGSGLGLSLTKNIIDKHRGRIEVESIYGKGTTFRVFLPVV